MDYYSGSRPFIGWVCGVCIAMYYTLYFVLGNIIWVVEFFKSGTIDPYPIKASSLIELAGLVIGMSALRTYEKIKKVDK